MNAAELSAALAARAADVAAMLLPAGKRHGREWRVGSVEGEAGQSMVVHLSGDRQGQWHDFEKGEGGDLLDLFAAVHRTSLADAMDEARRYLGVRPEPKLETFAKTYRRPARNPDHRRPDDAVKAWLLSRGLTDLTIAAFKVAAEGDDVAVFPYIRGDELVNLKRRSIVEKRKMWQEKDAEPCLFGWHLIGERCRTLAITEGEIDAMTLHQVGIPAVSCNAGAGNHQWIETDWDRLQQFSEILICYDADEPGQKGAREVAARLGIERCKIVRFPNAKDANEFLTNGAPVDAFRHAISMAQTLDPDELVSVERFTQDVIEAFYPPDGAKFDPCLRIGVDHEWFRFRPGEVTVWTGHTGHGKSAALGLVSMGLMEQGEKFVVFSGEMSPKRLLARMARQATGMDNPTIEYIKRVQTWLARSMWIFHVEGVANSERMLEVFRYAHRRYGVTHAIIDSLMMLEDVPEEGRGALEKQRLFMVLLHAFTDTTGVHAHLVAHPRKTDDEKNAPNKQQVSGSGKIVALADNEIAVWARLRDESEEDDGKPDAKVEVNKQRNGDVQHRTIWLWYDQRSLQHCPTSQRRPRRFAQEEPSA